MRTPTDHGARAWASQLLEMLIAYRLITDAWIDGEGFVVVDQSRCELTAEQVLDEYGERVAQTVTDVMEHSTLTTTEVPVRVAAPEGLVPYIADVDDRMTEYAKYWPAQ